MALYPAALQALIEQFTKFPGIGEKTAQRYAFHILRQNQQDVLKFAKLLMNMHDSIQLCSQCRIFSDRPLCGLCSNVSRDQQIICVVAHPHEISAIERTGEFKGVYHILGGTLNMLEGITPDKLAIKQLCDRINKKNEETPQNGQTKKIEIILAFNPDLEGESTSLYLSKVFKNHPVKVTRLARGLPRGADIEYADEITLGDAFKARREI